MQEFWGKPRILCEAPHVERILGLSQKQTWDWTRPGPGPPGLAVGAGLAGWRGGRRHGRAAGRPQATLQAQPGLLQGARCQRASGDREPAAQGHIVPPYSLARGTADVSMSPGLSKDRSSSEPHVISEAASELRKVGGAPLVSLPMSLGASCRGPGPELGPGQLCPEAGPRCAVPASSGLDAGGR